MGRQVLISVIFHKITLQNITAQMETQVLINVIFRKMILQKKRKLAQWESEFIISVILHKMILRKITEISADGKPGWF